MVISDLLNLLVAINMHGNERLLHFRKAIMEYLLRRDLELIEMSSE
jgi:hypothetical protein